MLPEPPLTDQPTNISRTLHIIRQYGNACICAYQSQLNTYMIYINLTSVIELMAHREKEPFFSSTISPNKQLSTILSIIHQIRPPNIFRGRIIYSISDLQVCSSRLKRLVNQLTKITS